MTDSEKIKVLLTSVDTITNVVHTLNLKLAAEVEGRLEMCMMIMEYTVRLKNQQNALARLIADSVLFAADENARREFLGQIAQLESECEHLERIVANAGG